MLTSPKTHRPNLTEDEVELLAHLRFDLADDEVAPYGTPLEDLVVAQAPWADWLEAAVLGGYVPHFEGIELALRAQHLFLRRQVDEALGTGVDGDALGWCDAAAVSYRIIIRSLELAVAEIELRAADMNTGARRAPDQGTENLWRATAEEHVRRATHALERAQSVAADDRATALERAKEPAA